MTVAWNATRYLLKKIQFSALNFNVTFDVREREGGGGEMGRERERGGRGKGGGEGGGREGETRT